MTTNRYPWYQNTTPNTADQDDPRYETPGGAQAKADNAQEAAEEYTNVYVNQTANLADDSVTRPKIAPGAVGAVELDPSLLDYTTDIAVAAKFNEVDAQLADIAINVKNYGATGSNVTDDTVSINNAIAYCSLLVSQGIKPNLIFPPAAGYMVNSGIVIPAGISVTMEAPINYGGTSDEVCITVGASGAVNTQVYLKLRANRNVVSSWLSENSIGIRIYNANTLSVEIAQAQGFTIGVQMMGSGTGVSYNNFYLGYLINNKYAVDLNNELAGWCNENNFFGGRFGVLSGINTGLSRYGVRVTSKYSYYSNNNVFYKPSFELNAAVASPGEAVPILIEFGNNNSFWDLRNEGNSNTTSRIMNSSTNNNYTVGFGTGHLEDASVYPANTITTQRDTSFTDASNLVYTSGSIHLSACYYDGATAIHVPNLHMASSGNSSVLVSTSALVLNSKYLEVPSTRGLGIFIKTTSCKKIVVRRDAENGFGGRVNIRCYDASGNILNDAGANHPYCKGSSHVTISYNSSFGNVYRTGTDSNEDVYFVVGDDVDYVCVILSGGTAALRIRTFTVSSSESKTAAAWVGYEEIVKGVNLMTTPPTAGTWAKGRRGLNGNPTAGQPKSWICTVAGTPGTWVSEGNL